MNWEAVAEAKRLADEVIDETAKVEAELKRLREELWTVRRSESLLIAAAVKARQALRDLGGFEAAGGLTAAIDNATGKKVLP